MRFLCDEMLTRLARLLRAAGHDAALAEPQAPDRALVERARAEGRVLVTRDRGLAARGGEFAVLLTADDIEGQAVELGRAVGVDWLAAPFTRCAMDNAVLREASAEEVEAFPEAARALPGPFNLCPACGRRYWPGSHVKRTLARLERLQAGRIEGEQPAVEGGSARGGPS